MVITDIENDAGSREATGRFQVALSQPKQGAEAQLPNHFGRRYVHDEINAARLRVATIVAARRLAQ